MAKKQKIKNNIIVTESYKIEVEDWEVNYRFGINTAPKDLIEGVYWAWSKLFS
jgi:hypothetical protein